MAIKRRKNLQQDPRTGYRHIEIRVVVEAGTSETKTETETWVAETKTETEAT